jgi:hypothetical protein
MKNNKIKIKVITNQRKKSESTRINSINPPHGTLDRNKKKIDLQKNGLTKKAQVK